MMMTTRSLTEIVHSNFINNSHLSSVTLGNVFIFHMYIIRCVILPSFCASTTDSELSENSDTHHGV